MIKTYTVPIMSKRSLALNTVEVTFDTSANPVHFVAGQYITVTLPGLENLGIKEQTHDFSIASSPSEKNHISIALRISQSAFKKNLLGFPIGSSVLLEGPSGIFTLPESTENPFVFIAGGIGITPFLSIITFVTKEKLPYQISLYYFNSNIETEAYREEVGILARENDLLSLYEIYGPFEKKHIAAANLAGAKWYVAGPPGMVRLVRQALVALHILDTNIRTEEFTGYE